MSSRRRRGCGCGCGGCLVTSTPILVLSLLALLFLAGEVIRFVVALIARPTAPSLTGVVVTMGILVGIQIGPRIYRWGRQRSARHARSAQAPQEVEGERWR